MDRRSRFSVSIINSFNFVVLNSVRYGKFVLNRRLYFGWVYALLLSLQLLLWFCFVFLWNIFFLKFYNKIPILMWARVHSSDILAIWFLFLSSSLFSFALKINDRVSNFVLICAHKNSFVFPFTFPLKYYRYIQAVIILHWSLVSQNKYKSMFLFVCIIFLDKTFFFHHGNRKNVSI